MKRQITTNKASRLINAGSVVLVSSSYKNKDNIVTIAWQAPCSYKPACILLALAKSHLSSELIKKSQEFVVNIPSCELKEQVVFCGSNSGRECDKFQGAKLTREKCSLLTKTPKVSECIGAIECSLADIKEIGDPFLFLGEPVYAEAEEELFDFDNLLWRENADLLFHLGGKFFMRQGPTM